MVIAVKKLMAIRLEALDIEKSRIYDEIISLIYNFL